MSWYIALLRAGASILTLFFLTKLMGKRQISQLTLFDYITGITIGSVAAEMSFSEDVDIINTLLIMTTYAVSAYFVSWVTCKSIVARRMITGRPKVLIERGKPLYKNMLRVKFDINDLLSELRSQGYFNISDIYYAVMEPNGHLSVLPKSGVRPATPQDLSLEVTQEGLVYNLIIDGKVLERNLKACGMDRNWLDKNLRLQGYESPQKVFLATCDAQGSLSVFDRILNEEKNCPFE